MNKNVKSTSIMMIQFLIYLLSIIVVHNCLFGGKFSNINFIVLGCMIISESILEYIKSKHSTARNSIKLLYSFTIVFCMFLGYCSAFWLVSPGCAVLWWYLFSGFCFVPNIVYNNKIISKKEQPWSQKTKCEKILIIITVIIMTYTVYQVVLFGVDFLMGL